MACWMYWPWTKTGESQNTAILFTTPCTPPDLCLVTTGEGSPCGVLETLQMAGLKHLEGCWASPARCQNSWLVLDIHSLLKLTGVRWSWTKSWAFVRNCLDEVWEDLSILSLLRASKKKTNNSIIGDIFSRTGLITAGWAGRSLQFALLQQKRLASKIF